MNSDFFEVYRTLGFRWTSSSLALLMLINTLKRNSKQYLLRFYFSQNRHLAPQKPFNLPWLTHSDECRKYQSSLPILVQLKHPVDKSAIFRKLFKLSTAERKWSTWHRTLKVVILSFTDGNPEGPLSGKAAWKLGSANPQFLYKNWITIKKRHKKVCFEQSKLRAPKKVARRVWSWLRINAGGVPYTCKSSVPARVSRQTGE